MFFLFSKVTKKDKAHTLFSQFPCVQNIHRNKHRITSMLRRKLCNWKAFWNMNNVFTAASHITLTILRAQGSQGRNFGHKGVYSGVNVELLLLWVCEVIAPQVSQWYTFKIPTTLCYKIFSTLWPSWDLC